MAWFKRDTTPPPPLGKFWTDADEVLADREIKRLIGNFLKWARAAKLEPSSLDDLRVDLSQLGERAILWYGVTRKRGWSYCSSFGFSVAEDGDWHYVGYHTYHSNVGVDTSYWSKSRDSVWPEMGTYEASRVADKGTAGPDNVVRGLNMAIAHWQS